MAQSQFQMTPQPNITQTLADRRPHAHAEAAAARLGLRSRRQARPGRHPATASLNVACWNGHSLSVHNDCDSHSPRKSALIDLEPACLSIDIARSVKPGSLEPDPFEKVTTPSFGLATLMDQDQDTVQVLPLETPCSLAWRTRLQSHLAS